MATATANAILNAICNNTSYAVAQTYMKLHIADPGAAGTTSPATETTRQAVSWGTAASGSIANDTAITWVSIAGSQDATHFSLWDNVSAGNFLGSGTITANAYTAGDTYNIAIGAATLTLTVAS
jgi:hypothetical protein